MTGLEHLQPETVEKGSERGCQNVYRYLHVPLLGGYTGYHDSTTAYFHLTNT